MLPVSFCNLLQIMFLHLYYIWLHLYEIYYLCIKYGFIYMTYGYFCMKYSYILLHLYYIRVLHVLWMKTLPCSSLTRNWIRGFEWQRDVMSVPQMGTGHPRNASSCVCRPTEQANHTGNKWEQAIRVILHLMSVDLQNNKSCRQLLS